MAKHWQKRMARDEYRRDHRRSPRREVGRTPNWVIQERREERRRDEEQS